MRATWTIGAIAGLGSLIALGCGSSDSGEGKASPDRRAVRALLDSMRFDGGVVSLERIPPTSDGVVELLSDPFAPLVPGAAGLLPFEEENPHDDDESFAVLLQFGEEESHVEVPVASSVSEEPGELSFAYELDEAVCEELCNRRYTITLTAAIKLESGGIGEHLESEIVLDCRSGGSEALCADGERSEAPPNTSEMDAGGDGDSGAGDGAVASDLIGEAGGTVSLPDGAQAVIPAMAVAEPTPIALRVAAQTPDLPSDVEGAGEAYVFEPHGTQFDEPVTLHLPFEGSATGFSVLFLDDEDDETWEQVEGTPTFEGGVAELEITHFSIYQVVRPRPATLDCATDNGGCDTSPMATCELQGSTRTCTCPSGYEGDGVGADGCSDVLECATNNGGCDDGYVCIENAGAEPDCDTDECATDNGGCGSPGYTNCIDNYEASPTCEDIDECATDNGACGDASEILCTNRTNNPVVCTQLWAQVDATDGPVCARRRNGTIACAGYDYTGGNAASIAANPTDIIDVATGQGNSCVVDADHQLTCYGNSGGSGIAEQTAAANSDPMQNFVDVEIGGYRLCALRTTGTLACFWSTDGHGTTNVRAFDVSWSHVCVVRNDGTLQCFGTDTNGCVSGPNLQPGNPSDPNNRYIDVSTGNGGTCALRENGTFICWGSASAAHVVDANANDEFDYVSVSMGNNGVCGVHDDHTVTCWGTTAGVTEINALGATNVAQVSVADYGICILGTDGSMQCYGTNTYGFQSLNTIGALP